MKKNHKTLYIALGTLALGLLLGWAIFGGGNTAKVEAREEITEAHTHKAGERWTCSMHPQIREDEPGQCPICGMDLTLVSTTGAEAVGQEQIQMTQAAMQIANVQTVTVQVAEPTKEIYLPGRVEADERNVGEITARFAGRIEKLYVNFTGQPVQRGQALASVYSPALITAQKELLKRPGFKKATLLFTKQRSTNSSSGIYPTGRYRAFQRARKYATTSTF